VANRSLKCGTTVPTGTSLRPRRRRCG
jgi:hypothetical protein